MKTVLIVEDELLARMGIRSLVNWRQMGIILLDDVVDGLEALRTIRSKRPDIVLLDINIPSLSGLELMRIIKKENIRTHIIIISSYDDFETVKEAMKLGAADYVRKLSLNSEELNHILLSAMSDLKAPGDEAAEQEKDVCEKKAIPGSEPGNSLCILPVWGNGGSKDLQIIADIAEQYLKSFHIQAVSKITEDMAHLWVAGESKVLDNMDLLREQLMHILPLKDVYIGITRNVNQKENPEAIHFAEQIVYPAFYNEDGKIIDFDSDLSISTHCPFNFTRYLENLINSIYSFSSGNILTVLSTVFSDFASHPYMYKWQLQRMMVDILGCFSRCAGKFGGVIEEVEIGGERQHYKQIMRCQSLKELHEWFIAFSEQFLRIFFVRSRTMNSSVLKETMDYIFKNIDSSIQLSEAAKAVGVSEQYLSMLFKKEMGENFVHWVNREKIQKSKKMIGDGLLIYQVSEMLGFENSTYFTKVFKKYEGETPENYRKSMMSKDMRIQG